MFYIAAGEAEPEGKRVGRLLGSEDMEGRFVRGGSKLGSTYDLLVQYMI